MSALPNFQYGDDYQRTAPPELVDAPTVTLAQSVNSAVSVMTGEADAAFGQNKAWWLDVANDLIADDLALALIVLLQPDAFPTLTRYVQHKLSLAIQRSANELLAEMDADSIERQELSQ